MIDTDEAREARRERLMKVRPLAAKDMLPHDEYEREYLKPHIVTRDNIGAIEQDQSVLFCPCCRGDQPNGLTKAQKLHIEYAPDPLNNYPAIVTTRCCGCDYVEHIPIIADPASPQDQQDASKYGGSTTAAEIQIRHQQKMNQMAQSQQQQMMDQYRQAQIDMARITAMPPMVVGNKWTDKLGFGHKLAQQVWGSIDRANEIRAKAAQYREHEKVASAIRDVGNAVASKVNSMDSLLKGVWIDESSALDAEKIREVKRMLDANNVPPDVRRSMVEKYWNKFRKKPAL